MGTHNTHSHGCGFFVGEKLLTHTHTHYTHTHRPTWILKPMLITMQDWSCAGPQYWFLVFSKWLWTMSSICESLSIERRTQIVWWTLTLLFHFLFWSHLAVAYTPPPILEILVGFWLDSSCIPGEFSIVYINSINFIHLVLIYFWDNHFG